MKNECSKCGAKHRPFVRKGFLYSHCEKCRKGQRMNEPDSYYGDDEMESTEIDLSFLDD